MSSNRVLALAKIPLLLSLVLLLSSCGSENDSQGSANPTGNAVCKVKKSNIVDPTLEFVAPINKVARSDFMNNSRSEGSMKVLSENSVILKKGQKVIITVDRLCIENRLESLKSLLTAHIEHIPKAPQFSISESYSFELPMDMSFSVLETIAMADECIEMISPEVQVKLSALPNDIRRTKQTHLNAIKWTDSFDFYFTNSKSISRDTVVAIIDDGIDPTHEDLRDLLWVNNAEKNGQTGVDDDNNGYIDDIHGYDFQTRVGDPSHKTAYSVINSHGTHVAGLIAAGTNNSVGISGLMAKNVKLMALNVFGNSDEASLSRVDAAIRYAADMGAKVINMSLGGPGSSSSTEKALKYAVSKGAIVLVAAGNDAQEMTSTNFFAPGSYGASINGVITVGATDANPSRVGSLCNFSNRSSIYVELGAPGCDTAHSTTGILSLIRNNQYGYMAGTSMATPVASGATAVVYSYVRDASNRLLTPAEVESFMKSGSRNIASIDGLIQNGKNLDLLSLQQKIDSDFPPVVVPEEPPAEEPEIPDCP